MSTSTHDPNGGALLFMHIPKTAGTSLRSAFGELYGPSERVYVYESSDLDGAVDPDAFKDLPEDARGQLRFVMGHFGYGIHEAIPGPSRYVTMLRDAPDRVASIYFHYKSQATRRRGSRGSRERRAIVEQGISLEDWVFGLRRLEVDNAMVRMVSGRPNVPFGTCPDDMLTEALEHVDERFDAVLIRGLMPQSAEILSAIVGRPLPSIPHENVNKARDAVDAVDASVRVRIEELNRLDREFFRLMLGRFSATYDRLVV